MGSKIRIILTVLLILAVSLSLIGMSTAAYGKGGKSTFSGKNSFFSVGHSTNSLKAFGTSEARASPIFGSSAESTAVSKEKSGANGLLIADDFGIPRTTTSLKAFGTSEAHASPIFGSSAESTAVSKEKTRPNLVVWGIPRTSQLKAFGESEAHASPFFGSSTESTALSKETFNPFTGLVVV